MSRSSCTAKPESIDTIFFVPGEDSIAERAEEERHHTHIHIYIYKYVYVFFSSSSSSS